MKKILNKGLKLNIKEKDMMFCVIAAAKGLTPEMLLECFTHDIVSYFSSEAVSIEEEYLARWFFGSWFSQDNDNQYFTFLQYIICNGHYKYVIAAINMLRKCSPKILKHRIVVQREYLKKIFKKYCAANPAHKSLSEEIKIIEKFEKKHKLCIKANFDCFNDMISRLNLQRSGNTGEYNYNNIGITALQ